MNAKNAIDAINPKPEVSGSLSFAVGDRIEGRWEIFQILKGGMGVVYIVYDHEHRLPYAAKTFRDDKHSDNSATAAEFIKEALAWVNLDAHENVTRAEFVQTIRGKPFLFLEYVSGGDLSGWIGTPRLTEDLPQALRFAMQFCDGMIHAAAKGIDVHRDIKPRNCLITEDHTLKITDFGLAKAFHDTQSAARNEDGAIPQAHDGKKDTRTGVGAGTSTHMAPEQFDDIKQVDVRADIYSFGVVLFQMLTGKLPFDGDTWDELKQQHQTQTPAPLPGSLPDRLIETVDTCLSKNSARRFADFDALRRELAAIYQQLIGAPAPQPLVGAQLDAAGWSNKGVSLSHLQRHAEALDCFERALGLSSQLKEAWHNKGSVLTALGRQPQALACFDHALALDPNFALAWHHKGSLLALAGRHAEALDCFERALGLNSQLKAAWHDKGSVLTALGRHAEALACYDRALTLDPGNPELWSDKAASLLALGRHPEALVCYDETLALDPGQAQAWSKKGRFLQALGRHSEALACYHQAFTLDPNVISGKFTRWAARILLSWSEAAKSHRRAGRSGIASVIKVI